MEVPATLQPSTSQTLTAGSIVGIVVGSLLGAAYLYCCFVSVRKAIRDRRAKIARNLARRKAKAFRDHHLELARKFNDIQSNGDELPPYPYIISSNNPQINNKLSIISIDSESQPQPYVFVSGRRRSSSPIQPKELKPKITVLPNRKYAKDNEAHMATSNSARPPPGLISGSTGGFQYHLPPYMYTNLPVRVPPLPDATRRIPLAMREESLDDCSDMSSEVSSFISGSHYALYTGPSFRRRNSYEHAMRRTNLPPPVHPLRDKRAQAAAALKAANAAARTIDRLAEAEAQRRKERENQRQIKEDIEGERRAVDMDGLSSENRRSEMQSGSSLSKSNTSTIVGENTYEGTSTSTKTESLTVQCPVWIHPDVPSGGYNNSGYSDVDYNNYL